MASNQAMVPPGACVAFATHAQPCRAFPQIVWTADARGERDAMNDTWKAFTGGEKDGDASLAWEDAVHPADREGSRRSWRRAVSTETPWEAELRLRRRDGVYRWHLARAIPIRDDLETLTGWAGTAIDVHEQKRIQLLLEGQERLVELVARGAELHAILEGIVLLIEALSDGVVGSILLLTGDELHFGAGPHLNGEYLREIEGMKIGPDVGTCGTAAFLRTPIATRDISSDARWAPYDAARTAALRSGLRACWSKPIFSKGGGVVGTFAMYRAVPSTPTSWDEKLLESAAHLAGIAIDRQAEETERLGLVDELRVAVSARDDFLSIASHELKTPLTTLRLQIEQLRRAHRAPAEEPVHLDAALDRIDRASRRLGDMIDDLLDVSRLSAGSPQLVVSRVDLSELARSVAGRAADAAAKAGSALVVSAPTPVVGEWDERRLDQVVTNLVSNAIKYGANRPVEVSVRSLGNTARLIVRDRGIGIAAADQPRIFRRFERAASARHFGGFGLGLWIVREIIRAHGGTIEVESAPGEGATFIVDLPKTPA